MSEASPPTTPSPAWSPPHAGVRPVVRRPPSPLVTLAVRPRRSALGWIGAVAVAFDVATRAGGVGLAATGVGLLAIVALPVTGLVPARRVWPHLCAAGLLACGLSLRADPLVLLVDGLGVFALLILAASLGRGGDASDLTVPGLATRAAVAMVHAGLAGQIVTAAGRGLSRRSAGVARGLLVALPVLLVVGALAAAGDAVFAGWLDDLASPGDLLTHLLPLAVGAWLMAALLRVAAGHPAPAAPRGKRWLGVVEGRTVLGGLVMLYSALATARIAAALGGAAFVERAAGLTYAEYARSGFFQLLWASGLTLATLMAVRAAVPAEREDRVVRALALATVGLALLIVISALHRLGLYVDAFGWTLLRLFAITAAVWVGVLLLCVGLAWNGVGRERAWVVPAAIAVTVTITLAVNVANPAGLVVRLNAARPDFDAEYAARLGDDAVPALVSVLTRVPPEAADAVRGALCGVQPSAPGLPAANLAAIRATQARAALCR